MTQMHSPKDDPDAGPAPAQNYSKKMEKKMTERKYCNKPDRDVPTIKCGYPLPCPWHTIIIDITGGKPIITIPDEANINKKQLKRITEIADAFKD